MDQALAECRRIARHLLAADVIEGAIDLRQSIILADDEGRPISEVPFAAVMAFKHAEDAREACICSILSSQIISSTESDGPSGVPRSAISVGHETSSWATDNRMGA
ncbi:hypothetical protein RQX22_14875 [Sphingosinicella sp. GR2756]|uniref:Uncharacterized protein n=1 Tax=Sphingosinicella rhizophila TaxID=3050082 RepID=A0ABU3QAC8_9SPHN|nr:hypothetical protein [Sphingosinicella sp. GR2756]